MTTKQLRGIKHIYRLQTDKFLGLTEQWDNAFRLWQTSEAIRDLYGKTAATAHVDLEWIYNSDDGDFPVVSKIQVFDSDGHELFIQAGLAKRRKALFQRWADKQPWAATWDSFQTWFDRVMTEPDQYEILGELDISAFYNDTWRPETLRLINVTEFKTMMNQTINWACV